MKDIFGLKENRTTVARELGAGVVTFMTLAYIIFVQPAILSSKPCGMDFGAVMTATCVAGALGTLLMGFLANYPIALAPAMGHNVLFAFVICSIPGVTWQIALGANFVSGAVFVLGSTFGLRARIMRAVPESLQYGIAVGIGLLIAMLGFQHAGIVVPSPGTIIGLGDIHNPPTVLSLIGLAALSAMLVLGAPGAILLALLLTAAIGVVMGLLEPPESLFSLPPSMGKTFLKLDIPGAFRWELAGVIFVLFFLDLFDTVGTLIGVGRQGGFIRDGRLPRERRALLADALATVTGTLCGTSTVTSYIESAAGISAGGRTGLANVATAALFIAALFFAPVVRMIGGGYADPQLGTLYPVTAPVLIVIGSFMVANVRYVRYDDLTESIPAFLALFVMPVTFSITEGIGFGFIAYVFLKVISGRGREVPALTCVIAGLFLLKYLALGTRL